MPGCGGHDPGYYARLARGRRSYEVKARAKGIKSGTSGWRRYMESHSRQFYKAGA